MIVLNFLKFQLRLLFKNRNYMLQLMVLPLVLLVIIGYINKDGFTCEFTSYQYYFIGVLIFIYSGIGTNISFNFIDKDNKSGNLRTIFAPVNNKMIYISHIFSALSFAFITLLVNLITFKFIFEVDFSESALMIFLVLLSVVFVSSSIGILFSLIIDDAVIIEEIFTVFQLLFCFIGGCFFSIESIANIPQFIIYLSPIKYVMDGLLQSMYENSNTLSFIIIFINVIIGSILIKVSSLFFKEENYV
ncbi:MAG: ABC transporter permease [Clostridium sp.]|nr:ABC transporter permease [Clostridium sp.]